MRYSVGLIEFERPLTASYPAKDIVAADLFLGFDEPK